MKPRIAWAVVLALLAGCGGGGGGEQPLFPPVPSVPSGQLDPTFGTNGRVELTAEGSVALGPDDRVYVAGFGIATLDERGMFTSNPGGSFYRQLVVDELGNAYAVTLPPALGIAKFHPDGRPYGAFGTNGQAVLPSTLSSTRFDVTDLARDPSGNLYLVGTRQFPNSSARYWALAKFDPTGRFMTEYGNDSGVLSFDLPGGPLSTARAAKVDSEGNVYVSGWASPWEAAQFTIYVAKFDRNGAFVREFGSAGVWFSPHCHTSPIPPELVIDTQPATAVTLDGTGDILVGGNCVGRPVVFRLDARGQVVASFRDSGVRAGLFGLDAEGSSNVTGLAVGPGGVIYAAGHKNTAANFCGDFAVAKLAAAGDAITSFGQGGIVTLDVVGDFFLEPLLDSRGRLYLAGQSFAGCPGGRPFGHPGSLYRLGG